MNLIKNLVDQKNASDAMRDDRAVAKTKPLPSRTSLALDDTDSSAEDQAANTAPATQTEVPEDTAEIRAEKAMIAELTNKKVWDILDEPSDEPETETKAEPAAASGGHKNGNEQNLFKAPEPMVPSKSRNAGRVKTRLMGFGSSTPVADDPFNRSGGQSEQNATTFPVGWLAITKGPGRGAQFTLQSEVSTIGRGDDQTIALNFGDDTISRNNHAAIAYDHQLNACFVGYGGKANLVRLNGRPVLATEQLSNGDTICVGQTTLRFVELCGTEFNWNSANDEDGDGVQI